MDTLILAILLAVPIVPTVFAWFRLRTKGYGRALIAICFVASILACYLANSILLGTSESGSPGSMGKSEALWLLFGIPLIWSLLAAGLAYGLPARKSRRISGPRRSPVPRLLAWLIVVVGGATSLFFLWQLFDPTIVPRNEGINAILVTTCLTLLLAGYCFGIDRRVKAAPAVLAESEGSVLYLRAFDAERQPFVSGDRSVLRRYTNQLKAHVPLARGKRNRTIHLTLEDYLEEAITSKIGPFVGLGNPADSLPPDGATREYAPDANWKERFLALAQNAKCIVIALGESDNLQWELRQIREQGLSQKLCLFTSPRPVDRELGSLSRALRSEAARKDALAASWASSCETMRRAGYDCDPVCPGPGAVTAFDQNGKSLLLTTEASSPDEYINPAVDWFNTGTKSGRWMPVSCKNCQETIYQGTGPAASGSGLCFSCQGEAEIARKSRLGRAVERHPVLGSIWGLLSLVIAALVAVFLSLGSKWWVVALWPLVLATPWVVMAGFRRLGRVRLHGDMVSSSTSTPVPSTDSTDVPPHDSQSR